MKKDEWILSKELGRLRKYGIYLNAKRIKENESYDIVFEKSRKVFEPSCSISEVLGITNALEQYSEFLILKNKKEKMNESEK
jgi:hypothetical protein